MIPQNQKFIQLTASPLEHITMQTGDETKAYWEGLPTYLIARCPLCGAAYTSKLDVHSLLNWGTLHGGSGSSFVHSKYEQVGCEHRLAVQRFTHLEGLVPSERSSHPSQLHVPFVSPFLVPKNPKSAIAVIHSFAICRLEDEQGQVFDYVDKIFRAPLQTPQEMRTPEHKYRKVKPIEAMSAEVKKALETAIFVPRYTGFAVTYYAAVKDHEKIRQRRIQSIMAGSYGDLEFYGSFMASMGETSKWGYNLAHWVQKGKLQWLDLASPHLPLKTGPVEDFPYANIPFDWDNHSGMRF